MTANLTSAELIALALVPVILPAGWTIHELSHYVMGKLAGGSPFFSKRVYGTVPTEVDFNSPEQMSDVGIRLTGGIVYIYPLAAFLTVALLPNNQLILFAPLWCFLLAASGISWFDTLALYHPEQWRRYTAYKPISRDMLD